MNESIKGLIEVLASYGHTVAEEQVAAIVATAGENYKIDHAWTNKLDAEADDEEDGRDGSNYASAMATELDEARATHLLEGLGIVEDGYEDREVVEYGEAETKGYSDLHFNLQEFTDAIYEGGE